MSRSKHCRCALLFLLFLLETPGWDDCQNEGLLCCPIDMVPFVRLTSSLYAAVKAAENVKLLGTAWFQLFGRAVFFRHC